MPLEVGFISHLLFISTECLMAKSYPNKAEGKSARDGGMMPGSKMCPEGKGGPPPKNTVGNHGSGLFNPPKGAGKGGKK